MNGGTKKSACFITRYQRERGAPLRRIDSQDPLSVDLRFLVKGGYTPTVVPVENCREIVRIRGYPEDDFFWDSLVRC